MQNNFQLDYACVRMAVPIGYRKLQNSLNNLATAKISEKKKQ